MYKKGLEIWSMLQKLKSRILIHREQPKLIYAFVQAWNMQVCLEKPSHYCPYVSEHEQVIKIVFVQKLVLVLFVKPFD